MKNHGKILEGLRVSKLQSVSEGRRKTSVGWGFATLVIKTNVSDNRDKIIDEFVKKVLGKKWRVVDEQVGDSNYMARETFNKSIFAGGGEVNTWLLVESVSKDMTFKKVTNWVEKLRSVVKSKGISCRIDYTTFGNSDTSQDPEVQREERDRKEEEKRRNLGLDVNDRFVVLREIRVGGQTLEVGSVWQSTASLVEGEDSMFVKMNDDGRGWFSPRTVIDISPDEFRGFRDSKKLVVSRSNENLKRNL